MKMQLMLTVFNSSFDLLESSLKLISFKTARNHHITLKVTFNLCETDSM